MRKILRKISLLSLLILTISVFGQVPSYVPKSGLDGYWSFSGNANDLSGNGNHGVVSGAKNSNGRNKQALSSYYFDGTNDYIKLKKPFFNGSTSVNKFTYFVIFKAHNSNGKISGKEGYWRTLSLQLSNSKLSWGGSQPNPNRYVRIESKSLIDTSEWYCAGVTFDGTALKLYLNDTLEVSSAQSKSSFDFSWLASGNSTSTNYFGAIEPVNTGITSYYKGYIDEFGTWSRVLSNQELSKLCAVSKPCTTTYSIDTITSCDPYTWTNGVIYTTSNNTATDTFVNAAGCDSIVTLNLTISGIPANGLIGYWPFNGNANDESVNGNNGTVSGANLTTDRFGDSNSAYYFDGVNDYIDFGNPTLLNPIPFSYTQSCWIKLVDYSASVDPILSKRHQNNGNDWAATVISSDGKLKFYADDAGHTGAVIASSPSVDTSFWHQFTLVKSGYSYLIYMNGNLVDSVYDSHTMGGSTDNLIAGKQSAWNAFFKGKIDDIGIWNRVLSASEIAGLYNANCCTTTSSTDTVTSCGPYTWTDGKTYTSSNNTAKDTFTNAAGCDSIVTLDLTIISSQIDTVLVDQFTMTFRSAFSRNSISLSNDSSYLLKVTGRCGYADGFSHNDAAWNYRWGANNNKTTCANGDIVPRKNIEWQSNNITNRRPINDSHNLADYCSGNDKEYIWTLDSLSGTQNFSFVDGGGYGDNGGSLDFKIYVLRTSDPVSYSTDTITSCGPYTWTDGVTYTSSNNTAKDTFVNAAGCDSIVTLNLTILSSNHIQIGSDIDGEAADDIWMVCLIKQRWEYRGYWSNLNDGNGSDAGHVRIYKNINGTWTQQGADIDGEAAADYSGTSVSLSSDGSTVAIGATGNNGNGTDAGHVRIYKNISGTWTQQGADIDGEAAVIDLDGLSH